MARLSYWIPKHDRSKLMKARALLLIILWVSFLKCDTETPFHVLTVINGSGSGTYELGQNVTIQAGEAPEEHSFYSWIGDTSHVEQNRAPETRVKMPLEDIVVEAVFLPLPKYVLTVINGSGSGEYLEQTKVLVQANSPDTGYIFVGWVGDTLQLESTDTAETYATIPPYPISIEATYEERIDLVSFNQTVFPIFLTKCSYAGCHDANDPNTPLVTYQQIKADIGPIEESILAGTMPQTGSLTLSETEAILTWIEQGAMNN